jgi:hypothetical protein
LTQLDQKLAQHIQVRAAGWQHKRGELIQGSRGVLVQWWSFPNRIVKIAVIPRQSVEEARDKMRLFVNEEREIEEVKSLGDEAYAWGYGSTNVVFRKSRYTIYVSTNVNVDGDQDVLTLTVAQRGERVKAEMKRLSKEFAEHIARALDAL